MSETLSDFRLKCIYALPSKVTRQDVLSMIEEITRLRHPASAGSEEAALRRENEDLKALTKFEGFVAVDPRGEPYFGSLRRFHRQVAQSWPECPIVPATLTLSGGKGKGKPKEGK